MFRLSLFPLNPFKHVTREGEGVGLPCPFSKILEKCPKFGNKNCPTCGHLWVKFLI